MSRTRRGHRHGRGRPNQDQNPDQRAPGQRPPQKQGQRGGGLNAQAQQARAQERQLQHARIQERNRIRSEIAAKLQQGLAENREAIKSFKKNVRICPHCNAPIDLLATALLDRKTGEPIHFECALDILAKQEHCSPSERIAYIGNGKFAVVLAETLGDNNHIAIRKIILWEPPDQDVPWRDEMAGLFSQV
jgi:hypothetical protein